MDNEMSISNCFEASSSDGDRTPQKKLDSLEIKSSSENKYIDGLPQSIPIIEKNYSLEPDMATGWIPKIKLPSPIPMSFHHAILDTLVDYYQNNAKIKHKLIYLGPRLVDSLEIHERYSSPQTYHCMIEIFEQFFPNKIKSINSFIRKQRKDLKKKNTRSFVGMNAVSNSSIIFDSDFESGNLDIVIETAHYEYDLFMRVDSNTRGHFSWYYFKIKNIPKGEKIKLNICNFTKVLYNNRQFITQQRCLYERGMRPYIFSEKAAELNKENWKQSGQNVKFLEKPLKYPNLYEYFPNMRKFYTLSFEIESQYDQDEIAIAYSIPYTYRTLNEHQESQQLKITKLGQSLSGIDVPLMTITGFIFIFYTGDLTNADQIQKKIIIITGRVHPGEANGSWVMQGFLNYILSPQCSELRKKAIFKVVPMLNPDGVLVGNYRTGIAGKDLNRQFKDTDKMMYPTIADLKQLVEESKNIFAFLDFHGHSVKKNVFTYGPEFPIFSSNYLKCRVLPKLLSNKTEMFRYWSSVFRVSSSKKRTSRVVFYQLHNIVHCFTVESSNGGFYSSETQKTTDFDAFSWLEVGTIIASTLDELIDLNIEHEKLLQMRKKQLLQRQRKRFSYSEEDGQSNENKFLAFKSQKQKKQKKGGSHSVDNQQSNESQMAKILEDIRKDEIIHQSSQDNKNEEGNQEGRSDSESSDDDLNVEELKKLRQEVYARQMQLGNQFVQSARNHIRNKKKIQKIKSTSKSFYVRFIQYPKIPSKKVA